MLDSRGKEINVGDEVAFKHQSGFKTTDMFIGTIIGFDKTYVQVKFNHVIKNKKSTSLYKLA